MSLRLRIVQVDVPASSLDEATAFWAGALSATPVRAPGGFVHLHDACAAVEVHLQSLDSGPARYHLDLEVSGPDADRSAEVARLVGLGASEGRTSADGYTVVRDPAGIPLCVIDPTAAPRNPLAPRDPDRGFLDAIFVDVPSVLQDVEVAFWAAALGSRAGRVVDEYVAIDGVAGPGGAVDLEVQRIGGEPRVHVDVSAIDVDAEAARLEALGATRVARIATWITLADPVGNLLCVVPATDGDDL